MLRQRPTRRRWGATSTFATSSTSTRLDLLNFVISVDEELGVDIPESD
jgi:hypothetical protein